MPKTYNLFISHSRAYGDAYDRLTKMLNAAQYFNYRDYSVRRSDPIHFGSDLQAWIVFVSCEKVHEDEEIESENASVRNFFCLATPNECLKGMP